jgi:DNA-binding response OmpR family regulator
VARILSVEDDVDLQHLLAMGLRMDGHDILYAYTGAEGMQKALSLEPDVLLLDMHVPLMNGAEVLEKLQAHADARYIPVIVLTGNWSDPRFSEPSLRAKGAAAYFKKPFRLDQLRDAVSALLRKKPKKPSSGQ